MNIELSTLPGTPRLEVLDLQISAKRNAGKSQLFFSLLFQNNDPVSHLVIPPLSWFDAHQLHFFLKELEKAQHQSTAVVDLPDTGIRLTGSVQRTAGRLTDNRTIQVSPLATSATLFSPFTVQTTSPDLKTYARKLYQRLWESFVKG